MNARQNRSSRRFWIGFATGWSVYFGVYVSVGLGEADGQLGRTALLGMVNTLPLALASAVVAFNRDRLWRSDWGAIRTLGVHVAVGLAFAFVIAGASTVLSSLTGMEPETSDVSPPLLFVYRMLSSTFVYMMFLGCLMWAESMHRVRAGEAAIARAAVLRAEAEARAIRAQFNPHFVFNTLHSLMLLVRADPAGAERAIEDVATLIRYASIIQRRDIDAVPLAKELEVARRYLALERLRLQDRLTVEWVVDVDPGAVTVPAFSLQTLVENAIKHGLEAKSEGGCVRIELAAASDVLTIRVSDDGAGADASSIHPVPGHGLALLRSRLASRYGENGRLDWTTAPGQGFSATVTLPMERPTHLAELDVIEARQPARSGV